MPTSKRTADRARPDGDSTSDHPESMRGYSHAERDESEAQSFDAAMHAMQLSYLAKNALDVQRLSSEAIMWALFAGAYEARQLRLTIERRMQL